MGPVTGPPPPGPACVVAPSPLSKWVKGEVVSEGESLPLFDQTPCSNPSLHPTWLRSIALG